MPIQYDEDVARLDDICVIEEADTLKQWLATQKQGEVDLKNCTHCHTAVLQVLLALRPKVRHPPEDAFLREWVFPLVENF